MLRDYLIPLSENFDFEVAKEIGNIGGFIQAYTLDNFPGVKTGSEIIIIGVPEERNAIDNEGVALAPDAIRQAFYNLFPGKWHKNIVDLGNLKTGESADETYRILGKVLSLLPVDVSVIVLGGSQDLTLGLTNCYDINNKTYNLNVIDAFIDGSLTDYETDNENYLSVLLRKEKSRLQNLTITGIQGFLNHPGKFKDFEQLYVDVYNLGEIKNDVYQVEPDFREAHIVSLDVRSINFASMPAQKNGMPNGFDGIDICKISRMSGAAPGNKIFGVFEYNPLIDQRLTGANMTAQILWYYIEGKNLRQKEYPGIPESELLKFYVKNEVVDLVFYKNPFSERWWVEIPDLENPHSLFPCSESDYKNAVKSKITKKIRRIIDKMTI